MKKHRLMFIAAGGLFLLSACGGDTHVANGSGKACPDWSSNPVSNYSNEDFSNAGCATGSNNYAQLKDPADFNRGTGNVKINAIRDSNVLQGYLSGTAAAAAPASASSATSSR